MADKKVKKRGFFKRLLNFRGLAFRSGCFFFIGVFLILFVSFTYILVYAAQMMLEQAKKEAANTTILTISRMIAVLQPVEEVTNSLASSISPEKPDFNSILRLSKDYVITSVPVFGTCLAFEPYAFSKEFYYYAPYFYESAKGYRSRMLGSKSYDYFNLPWYSIPKKLNKPYWSDPYFDEGGGDTKMCTYAVPFYLGFPKEQKKFSGVLTMDVSLKTLDTIVSGVHVYKSGFALLISRTGKVLACPKKNFKDKDIRDIVQQKIDLDGIDDSIASKRKIRISTKRPSNTNNVEITLTDSLPKGLFVGKVAFPVPAEIFGRKVAT